MSVKVVNNDWPMTGGQPLNTEHDGLQPQGDTSRAVSLGGLPQRFEALERARIASCKDGLHSRKQDVVFLIREPVSMFLSREAREKGAFLLKSRF